MRHVVYFNPLSARSALYASLCRILTLYLLEAHYMRHVVYFNPLPARGALYASCGVF